MTGTPGFRWEEADRLFDQALEQPPSQRERWLDQSCAGNAALRDQVEALLRADAAAAKFLEIDGWRLAESLLHESEADSPDGRLIGPYRVVHELARGGMGVVYLAERADGQFEQRVALKLIKRGMDSDEIHRRFLAERQILAQLSHPHIARLLDGGVSAEGQPWFAIEYVEGTTITAHCANRGLDREQRLGLFLDVCDAVRYAHQNLVVHRDLKPSNILVTADGQVKLLDFGIAKLLRQDPGADTALTETGVRVMTPEYASPEQVYGLPVTTATDVYALGTVLYELLAGRRAHQLEARTPSEVERIVCRVVPSAPSSMTDGAFGKHLRGDLDTITLRALSKEPERRYATVDQLAGDLRRHLGGLPVIARPDTWRYRATKFVGRHRIGVAAAVAIGLSLVGGLAGTIWQARVAAERAQVASGEAQKQKAVRDFLVQLFQASDPKQARGREITARELLDRGRRGIDTALAAQPEVRAELLTVLAIVNNSLGSYAQADTLFRQAVALTRSLAGNMNQELVARLTAWAENLLKEDQDVAADTLLKEAYVRVRSGGVDDSTVARTLCLVGRLESKAGNHVRAVALTREALAIDLRNHGDGTREVANDLDWLVAALFPAGDQAGADSANRSALAIWLRLLGPDHPVLLESMTDGATVRMARGDYLGADTLLREVLAAQRRVFPEGHPEVAQAMDALSFAVQGQGRYEEAESLQIGALELFRSHFGAGSFQATRALNNLARTRFFLGDVPGAERDVRHAMESFRRLRGPEASPTLAAMDNLSVFLRELGRDEEASALSGAVVAGRRKILGDSHPDLAVALRNSSHLRRRAGETTEAERILREALAIDRKALPEGHAETARACADLGAVLNERGQPVDAEPLLREALATQVRLLGSPHHVTSATRRELGFSLALQERYPEAEKLLLEAYRDLGARTDYWGRKGRNETLRRLVELYHRTGATGQARRYERLLAMGAR